MIDQSFEYRRLWTELYEEKGLEAVRVDVANTSLDYRHIGESLIKEIEEKERLNRDELRNSEDSEIAKRTLNWTAIAVLVGCVAAFLAYKALAH